MFQVLLVTLADHAVKGSQSHDKTVAWLEGEHRAFLFIAHKM